MIHLDRERERERERDLLSGEREREPGQRFHMIYDVMGSLNSYEGDLCVHTLCLMCMCSDGWVWVWVWVIFKSLVRTADNILLCIRTIFSDCADARKLKNACGLAKLCGM